MARLRRLTRLLFGIRARSDFRELPLPPSAAVAKTAAARIRGMQLLMQNLTSEQTADYNRHHYFVVRGGRTGRRYRIRHGTVLNVDMIDRHGKALATLCFGPIGNLVEGDVMLTQKLALELFEDDVIHTANWGRPNGIGLRAPLM
jgi:hypothetical protein